MHLLELLAQHPQPAAQSVPAWMLGLFRRHCISFADGSSDSHTQVFWLQSRNFSIDLRLPVDAELVAQAKQWTHYSAAELAVLANYEGWVAQSIWDGQRLSWHAPTSLQLHNRWPEPALLQRVGNCMMEFADSHAYIEDWRLQPSNAGPLIGLRLLNERSTDSGELRRSGGGLIICGDHAGIVLGRALEPSTEHSLSEQVAAASTDAARLELLLDMETSIAHGSLADGFVVSHSTRPGRCGQPLTALDGFTLSADGVLEQALEVAGEQRLRRYSIDTLEPQLMLPMTTPVSPTTRAWSLREAGTLQRYTRPLL